MDDDCIITRMKHKQITREIAELAKMYQRTTAQECLSALQRVSAYFGTMYYVTKEKIDGYLTSLYLAITHFRFVFQLVSTEIK